MTPRLEPCEDLIPTSSQWPRHRRGPQQRALRLWMDVDGPLLEFEGASSTCTGIVPRGQRLWMFCRSPGGSPRGRRWPSARAIYAFCRQVVLEKNFRLCCMDLSGCAPIGRFEAKEASFPALCSQVRPKRGGVHLSRPFRAVGLAGRDGRDGRGCRHLFRGLSVSQCPGLDSAPPKSRGPAAGPLGKAQFFLPPAPASSLNISFSSQVHGRRDGDPPRRGGFRHQRAGAGLALQCRSCKKWTKTPPRTRTPTKSPK